MIDHFDLLASIAEKMLLMRSHFFSPEQIKNMFSAYKVRVSIKYDGRFNSWIIVAK
jgi:hypothetical protein